MITCALCLPLVVTPTAPAPLILASSIILLSCSSMRNLVAQLVKDDIFSLPPSPTRISVAVRVYLFDDDVAPDSESTVSPVDASSEVGSGNKLSPRPGVFNFNTLIATLNTT